MFNLLDPYEAALRERIVRDYIVEHGNSPSRPKLLSLLNEARRENPAIETVGFSSLDIEVPGFRDVSSAAQETKNRKAAMDDARVLNQRVEELIQSLEDSYRTFSSAANRAQDLLMATGRRLDNLLLLAGRTDQFVYGVEESFDSLDSINMESTTATVERGYATMGRQGYTKVDLAAAEITFSTVAPKGIISSRVVSHIDSLKDADANVWEYHAKTTYSLGRVSLSIDIDFGEKTDVNDVRVIASPVDVNSTSTWTLLYSRDGGSFKAVKPAEKRLRKGENLTSLGLDGVRKLRVVITKTAADITERSTRENFYVFSLDALEIFTDSYKTSAKSELYAGPYEVLDENGDPYEFSMATMGAGTCCIVPDKTSVDYFLSKDNERWYPCSWRGESLNIVRFSDTNPEGSFDYIDSDQNSHSLIPYGVNDLDFDFGKEAYLNLYVNSDVSKLIPQSVVVKRNLPQEGLQLYGTESGWFYDSTNGRYKTTFVITPLEGRWLNLGTTSAIINGAQVSGRVHLKEGTHTFETSESNWYSIDSDIDTLEELEASDPAYPYNHKYLVEGYRYPSGFAGEQLYHGVDEFFGSRLHYVTPEKFEGDSDDDDLTIYTIVRQDGRYYFKVKVDPHDGSWKHEHVSVEYTISKDGSGNQIYVKALLRSADPRITPHISHFQVRVI